MEAHATDVVLNKNGEPEATVRNNQIQIMEHSAKQLAWTLKKKWQCLER